jgi:hypothetical protein
VDYVRKKTDCDLHMLFRTASVKVAVGYVYPSEDGATHHHMPIPPGCVRVGVDEIFPGFETVELDIPSGDDEKTLADVKLGSMAEDCRSGPCLTRFEAPMRLGGAARGRPIFVREEGTQCPRSVFG